ncbi:MAG: DUF349 domain-containing protein [Draconibacterium sp.]|nr:DUF349 domain-containing protein [Draconibacterium sp.]
MVSKDLKSSKELEKTENSEIENSEQIIDSETSLSVDSTIEIDEESVKSVEKPLPVDEKVLEKTDEETVDLLIDEPDNVEEEILVSEIVETTVTPEIIEESPSIENSTIEETEKPSVETKEAEIVDSGEPEESDLKATEELAAPIKTKTKKVQKVEIEQELKEEAADLPQDDKKDRIDYSKYTQIELVNALRDLIDAADDNDIKAEVEIIKSVYYKQRNESVELAHATFIEEGGAEEEFVAEEDPYENDIREQLKKFGQLRKEHNRQLDSEKDDNLARKFEIIEKIKGLINNEESINKTFNEFRDLQREWREIGLVPQSK